MTLSTTERQFLHLLRAGVRQEAPDAALLPPESTDWAALRQLAMKQTVSELVFSAIGRLPEDCKPPRREVILPWLTAVEEVYSRSDRMLQAWQKAARKFTEAGFHCCLLKGFGMAQYYPDYHMRPPGDLDLWLWPASTPLGATGTLEERRQKVVEYVRRYNPSVEVVYHHVDFNVLPSAPMELHFTPTWMNSPRLNRWLQEWMEKQAPACFKNYSRHYDSPDAPLGIPTPGFNVVYLLLHIFRHLFTEGIGLRQVVDYYYLLTTTPWHSEAQSIRQTLRHLGLERFTAALMYVLQQVFGLPEEHMICPPHPARGAFLLQEIMLAGNFGQHDTRFRHYADGTLGAFITRSRRNLRFLCLAPEEVICTPMWKVSQYLWRRKNGFITA